MLGRLLGNRLLTKQTFTPCHTGAAQRRRGHKKKKEKPGEGESWRTDNRRVRKPWNATRAREGEDGWGTKRAGWTSDAGASAPLSINNLCQIIDAISFIHPSIHSVSFIHSFIHSVPFIHSFFPSFIHSINHSFIHSSFRFIRSFQPLPWLRAMQRSSVSNAPAPLPSVTARTTWSPPLARAKRPATPAETPAANQRAAAQTVPAEVARFGAASANPAPAGSDGLRWLSEFKVERPLWIKQ